MHGMIWLFESSEAISLRAGFMEKPFKAKTESKWMKLLMSPAMYESGGWVSAVITMLDAI